MRNSKAISVSAFQRRASADLLQRPGAGTMSLANRSDIEPPRHGKKQTSRKYEE
jgi:hypothetical protein